MASCPQQLSALLVCLVLVPFDASADGIAIDHKEVGCVVAGKFPQLFARFDPADSVARARVVFRPTGGPHWYSVPMKPEGLSFIGILPEPEKSLTKFDYYITVADKAFNESRTEEYSPIVVAVPGGCESGKVLAVALGKAKAVLVSPPDGIANLAKVPVGFSDNGVIAGASSTGTSTAGSSSTGSTGTTTAGTGGAGGGLSTTAVVGIVAGGAAVAGAVAVAAGGGGGGTSGGGTTGGGTTPTPAPPPTTTPGQAVTGRWMGTINGQELGTCSPGAGTASLDLSLSGSGTTVTGQVVAVLTSVADSFCQPAVGSSIINNSISSGTASGGSIQFTAGGANFSGTYSGSSMSGSVRGTTTGSFSGFPFAGTWTAQKQ